MIKIEPFTFQSMIFKNIDKRIGKGKGRNAKELLRNPTSLPVIKVKPLS